MVHENKKTWGSYEGLNQVANNLSYQDFSLIFMSENIVLVYSSP